jgi:hypothetical protein
MASHESLLPPSLSRRWQRRMQHQWRRAAADLTAYPFFFARERELQVASTGEKRAAGHRLPVTHTHHPHIGIGIGIVISCHAMACSGRQGQELRGSF